MRGRRGRGGGMPAGWAAWVEQVVTGLLAVLPRAPFAWNAAATTLRGAAEALLLNASHAELLRAVEELPSPWAMEARRRVCACYRVVRTRE